MLRISNVLRRDHTLTHYEEGIIDSRIGAIILLIFDTVLGVIIAIDKRNLIMIPLAFLISSPIALLLLCQFLDGCRYIRKFNQAVRNGTKFEGTIVEKRLYHKSWVMDKPTSLSYYRLIIRLSNGDLVETPRYNSISDLYKKCDVYLYKKKYYFTGFRYEPRTALSGLEFLLRQQSEKLMKK